MRRPAERGRATVTRGAAAVGGVLALTLACGAASAQARRHAVGLDLGTGLELGGQGNETILRRAPLFADVGYTTWSDEDPELLVGCSARVEMEGRASVAAVPYAALRHPLGALELLAGVGIPIFFFPFTMVGVEGSLTTRLPLGRGFGLLGVVSVTAYFMGSDVPSESAVLMFNGRIGVDVVL